MSATAQSIRPIPQFNASRLRLAEVERVVWAAVVPMSTTVENLTEPAFWAHVASKLTPRSKIEVHVDGGAWYAELLVLETGPTWASVLPLGVWPLATGTSLRELSEEALKQAFADFSIDFRGSRGWSVVRRLDSEVMAENMNTRDSAEDWLRGWARKHVKPPPAPQPEAEANLEPLGALDIRPGRGNE